MEYVSICSGIEAATMAWHGMGWKPLAFSEIEKFPSAVLAHHYPDVTNEGDFTKIGDKYDLTDGLLVGGTPCQSFSVAGLRGGMDDDRGNLALEFLKLARDSRAKWVVWENVPGVLSSNGGRDFGSILGGLEQLGYGWAYRVLDAQYFGVAQRRRRVFVVGCLGSWQCASAVLFERASLQGNPPPSREAGKGTTHETSPCVGASGRGISRAGEPRGQDPVVACPVTGNPYGDNASRESLLVSCPTVSPAVKARDCKGPSSDGDGDGAPLLTYTMAVRGRGDSRVLETRDDGTANAVLAPGGGRDGMGVGAVAVCLGSDPLTSEELAMPVTTRHGDPGVVCHDTKPEYYSHDYCQDRGYSVDSKAPAVNTAQHHKVRTGMAVRRLTPVEVERLQGFPDNYTRMPWKRKPATGCPDGPRYRALGNSMAVPVMKWIGERIEAVDNLDKEPPCNKQ